mmetsp:Transcript_99152/g.212469  ORF Transcript_99152/g.212469 Transcript_99152/m.212469 type:complete len:299 (+) Transcript_99152:109-1005(+)
MADDEEDLSRGASKTLPSLAGEDSSGRSRGRRLVGPRTRNGGLDLAGLPEEEKMQLLRRQVSLDQEQRRLDEERQRKSERKLAEDWQRRRAGAREADRLELQNRLGQLKVQRRLHAERLSKADSAAAVEAAASAERLPEAAAGASTVGSGSAARSTVRARGGPGPRRRRTDCQGGGCEPVAVVATTAVVVPPAASAEAETEDRDDLGFHNLVCDLLKSGDSEMGLRRIAMSRPPPTEPKEAPSEDDDVNTGGDDDPAAQRHLSRRYRLRMMQQVAGQVLQCRSQMKGAFQDSFLASLS